MFLSSLSISNFRNIIRADLSFHKRYTLIMGDNAQGKTNLLEAVHYLLTAQSFMSSRAEDLINFNASNFFVKGTVKRSNMLYNSIISYNNSIKKVIVNNNPINRLSHYKKYFSCVSSSAGQIEEFIRGPAHRRRIFDHLIMQFDNDYIKLLKDYYKTLKNRNKLLKLNDIKSDLFSQYTDHQIHLSVGIMEKRLRYTDKFIKVYNSKFYDKFSLLIPSLKPVLLYNNKELDMTMDIHGIFNSISKKNLQLDLKMGFCTWSLSRSDFVFYLDNKPILNYASRGQLKLIIILLFLIQSEIIRELDSVSPVLLIDDMFGEMGDAFISTLLYYLDSFEQVFITNIHNNNLFISDYDMIIMKNGNPIKRGDN